MNLFYCHFVVFAPVVLESSPDLPFSGLGFGGFKDGSAHFSTATPACSSKMSNACRRVDHMNMIHAAQSEMKHAVRDGTDDVQIGVAGVQSRSLQAFLFAPFDLIGKYIFSVLHGVGAAEANLPRKHVLLVHGRQPVLALQLFNHLGGFQVVIEIVSRASKIKTEVRRKVESSHNILSFWNQNSRLIESRGV